MKKITFVLLIVLMMATTVLAQGPREFVAGDTLPGAPELAARGEYNVGVRTLDLTNEGVVDVYAITEEDPLPTYDRTLTVDVWYPAIIPEGEEELTEYSNFLGRADSPDTNPPVEYTFAGRALRDAEVDTSGGTYPLIVVSHGYPGSRYLMTYLTENLASKGYIVVAISHTFSTYSDMIDITSSFVHRAEDQIFIIDEMERLNEEDEALAGLIDTENIGLVGYSVGGFGALNTIGAGYRDLLAGFAGGEAISPRLASNPDYTADPRVDAALLFAPWGGDLTPVGFAGLSIWADDAFQGITIPTMWVVGEFDDVSIYSGVLNMFENSINSDRILLTYENALHNVAPNPAPEAAETFDQFQHFSDPVWDTRKMNNINQHFSTAFFGLHLKGDDAMSDYLDIPEPIADEAVYDVDDDGNFTDDHTYWPGFEPRTLHGLYWRVEAAE